MVALNLCMLNWFAKLPWAGHLWFITGIMFLYIVLMVLSRVPSRFRLVFIAVLFIAQFALALYGVRQAYVFSMIIPAAWLFLGGRQMQTAVQRTGFVHVVFGLSLVLACLGSFALIGVKVHDALRYWIFMAGAIGMVVACCAIQLPEGAEKPLYSLSLRSYEMYLVHFPIVCWLASTFMREHMFAWLALYLVLSLCAGWLLHGLSERVRKTVVGSL